MPKKIRSHHYKRMIKNIFLKDLHLKSLSLLLAIGLWFTVTSSERVESVKRVAIDYVTAPGFVVSDDTPKFIDIKLNGPRIFIREVMDRREFIKLDIRGRKEPQFTYKFYSDMMNLPIGVKVLEYYPSEVNIKIEKLGRKKVKVIPSIVGELLSGYRLEGVKIEPTELEISGSELALKGTDELYTQVIDVSKYKVPMRIETTLDKRYYKQFSNFSAERFTVYVDVKPVVLQKRFNGLTLDILGQNSYSINVKRVDVVVKGSKSRIESLDVRKIRPYLDISFNAPGKHSEDVKVRLPEDIELVTTYPKNIDIVVNRED